MGIFGFWNKKKPLKTSSTEIRESMYGNGIEAPAKTKKANNDDLSVEWYVSNHQTIQLLIKPIEDEMVSHAAALKDATSVDDRKELLECIIRSFRALEKQCAALGAGGKRYFSEMWLHLHNSKNPDFSYVDKYEQELKELNENYEKLKSEEEIRNKELKNLDKRVLDVLSEQPEILQTDVYKKFHPIAKKDVQSILYRMEKEGTIIREKSGKTYLIHKK